jgi:hypothetical protein
VDVVEEPVRKARFQQEIDRDRALAFDAVERCLERINEGAAKPGNQAAEPMPDQPWQ